MSLVLQPSRPEERSLIMEGGAVTRDRFNSPLRFENKLGVNVDKKQDTHTEKCVNIGDSAAWKDDFAEIWLNDTWVKVKVEWREGSQTGKCSVKRCDGFGEQFLVKAAELARFGSHDPESKLEIWKRLEYEKLEKLLDDKGFTIEKMKEDGNCLFREVARQIYGDAEKYWMVRDETVDHIISNRSFYSAFETNMKERLTEQLMSRSWGGHLEIAAMSDLYHAGILI